METRANYLLVGLFVIALFLGSVVFVGWLTDLRVDQRFDRYDIAFTGSVAGLRDGATVSYRGINVGTVEEITIDPENLERILVTVQVDADTPVRSNTTATLAIQGLAGGAYILLSGGTEEAPPLEPPPGRERAVIVAQSSGLQELLESAPSVLSEANIVLQRANDLLKEENREQVAIALETLTRLLRNLDSATSEIPGLVDRTGQTIDKIGQSADSMTALAGSFEATAVELPGIVRQSNETLEKVGRTADGVSELTTSLNESANKLPGVIDRTDETLEKAGATADSVTSLAGNLDETAKMLPGLAEQSGETLERFGQTAESITALADGLATDSRRLAEQADATLGALRSTAETLNETVDQADDDVAATLTAIRNSAENFEKLAVSLEGFVAENREPLAEFSNQGLFEITTFFNQARELVNNVNRLLLQVERDPGSFIFGSGSQGYEPPEQQ